MARFTHRKNYQKIVVPFQMIKKRENTQISTNYYMLTQNKKLADTYFPEEYELYRGGDVFKAEIHIGKSSAG